MDASVVQVLGLMLCWNQPWSVSHVSAGGLPPGGVVLVMSSNGPPHDFTETALLEITGPLGTGVLPLMSIDCDLRRSPCQFGLGVATVPPAMSVWPMKSAPRRLAPSWVLASSIDVGSGRAPWAEPRALWSCLGSSANWNCCTMPVTSATI